MSFFWVGHFEFFFRKKIFFFCFIPMKISPNLYGRMDGSKFWCFPWFPENSLLCVILCYTVYKITTANNSLTDFFKFWKQQTAPSTSFSYWQKKSFRSVQNLPIPVEKFLVTYFWWLMILTFLWLLKSGNPSILTRFGTYFQKC